MKSLTLRTRRAIVLLLVGVSLVLTANFLLGLRWFGDYDAEVAILSFAVAYVVDYFIGLSHEELLSYRASQRNQADNS